MFASASQALVLGVHQHDPAWFPNSYIKCWLRTKLDLTFFLRVSVSMQWLEARDHISAPYTIDSHLLPLSPWQCWWLVHSRQALYHWVTSQPSALFLESGCVTKLRASRTSSSMGCLCPNTLNAGLWTSWEKLGISTQILTPIGKNFTHWATSPIYHSHTYIFNQVLLITLENSIKDL